MSRETDYPQRVQPEPEWFARAACQGADLDLFFPGSGGATSAALAICARCPVKAQCLAYALENREGHGVWGGKTELQRRQLQRGRPVLQLTVCATERGFQRHRMRGEDPCGPCRAAHSAAMAQPYGAFPE